MSNPIRQAIDSSLSSLKVTDRDVNAIMERIRQDGQPQSRRFKLRYAVALALLLALLTVGGTAAMFLTPREIISEEVLPMTESAENGLWLSREQVEKVLSLALANNLKLSETSRQQIDSALFEYDGYWTELLIEDLMNARYGSMSEWPQEEMTWYKDTIGNLEAHYAEGRNRGPAEGEMTGDEAIARAVELIGTMSDEPLDDPERYRVEAYFFDGLLEGGYPDYYWAVHILPRVVDASQYYITLSATGDRLYQYTCWPGASAQVDGSVIRNAFYAIYGPMEKWSQETLREFADYIRRAEENGRNAFIYYGYMARTEYPDVAPEAIDPKAASAAALEALGLTEGADVWIDHIAYMGSEPNPIWKVSIHRTRDVEGYSSDWEYYVEVDSVTGDVGVIDESGAVYRSYYMYAPHSVYQYVVPDIPEDGYPSVTAEQARMNAVIYLQERYGELRDLNDPAVFAVTVEEAVKYQWALNEQWLVLFDAVEPGTAGYWAYVDGFGQIMAAGVDNGVISLTGHSVDSIRLRFGDELLKGFIDTQVPEFALEVKRYGDTADPIVRLINQTSYADFREVHWNERADVIYQHIFDALGLKKEVLEDEGPVETTVLIEIENPDRPHMPRHVWKIGLQTNRGKLLVEVEDESLDILSAVTVENLYAPWYACMLLQSDMEAAGIAPQPFVQPENNGLVTDEGTVRGLRLKHIYDRFRDLYGPTPLGWSQAQLQSFRQALVLSSSLGRDMGISCMEDTSYPSVPETAITREEAALAGARAMSLTDYEVEGAVLIADMPAAVWKVCYRTAEGYRYAEVDCLSGEVKTTAERSGDNNWYQDIVLERVIREHEETFHSMNYGRRAVPMLAL